jgi:hypothetical protein
MGKSKDETNREQRGTTRTIGVENRNGRDIEQREEMVSVLLLLLDFAAFFLTSFLFSDIRPRRRIKAERATQSVQVAVVVSAGEAGVEKVKKSITNYQREIVGEEDRNAIRRKTSMANGSIPPCRYQ